ARIQKIVPSSFGKLPKKRQFGTVAAFRHQTFLSLATRRSISTQANEQDSRPLVWRRAATPWNNCSTPARHSLSRTSSKVTITSFVRLSSHKYRHALSAAHSRPARPRFSPQHPYLQPLARTPYTCHRVAAGRRAL